MLGRLGFEECFKVVRLVISQGRGGATRCQMHCGSAYNLALCFMTISWVGENNREPKQILGFWFAGIEKLERDSGRQDQRS